MNLIEISSIIIPPDRQRKVFSAAELHALADSIQTKGLFHPVILRQSRSGDFAPEEFRLVAGERRLRAVSDIADLQGVFKHDGQDVPPGFIPYVTLAELSPLEAEEAELEENIQRENLTWQEKAAATARLSKLRTAQATERGDVPPTPSDIAEEARGSSSGDALQRTRRELAVARHLAIPEVAAAKTLDEAFKVLKKKEERARNEALGDSVGRTFTADMHRAYNLDAEVWLATCPDGAYDCILTDPPYGMGADEFGDSGGVAAGAHGYKDSTQAFEEAVLPLIAHAARVTKPQAHLYLFCDPDRFIFLREAFTAAGWWTFRTPLIWHKPAAIRAPWPENGPQRKYEFILYAVKGKRPILRMGGDVLAHQPDTNLGHAAQKPVALFKELLERTCRPGDSVLDCFMGSGTIFPAAHELKVKATGIEMDTSAYGVAVKRLEELKLQMELGL